MLPPIETLTPEQVAEYSARIDAAELAARGMLARALDDPEGFGHFFWCITGHELPPYAAERWVPEIWKAKSNQTGVLLEAFRGSTKSTVLSTFCLFRIGHNPEKSGLIVMSNDDAANKMSAYMAAVIEFSAGWKAVFPNVVPDKERGWGAQGYHVFDKSLEHNAWVEKTLKDHQRDPSFVAAGITSSDIVGMHPTNFLYIDDIHDEKNSISERERENVINSLRKNLLPTMSRPGEKPFICFAYTPWVDGDAYQLMESTGVLTHLRTPLYTEVPEGDEGAELFDNKWVRFAWPSVFGAKYAEEQRQLVKDRVTYALMYLLDREAAKKERLFRYYSYPNERVNFGWPMQGGADYAGVIDPRQGKPGGRSHFSLAYVAKTPEGFAVVVDGVVEQYSPSECDDALIKAQGLFTGWLGAVIETDGKTYITDAAVFQLAAGVFVGQMPDGSYIRINTVTGTTNVFLNGGYVTYKQATP